MSENNNPEEENDKKRTTSDEVGLNRRKMLQMFGTGAFTAAGLAGISGTSHAASSTETGSQPGVAGAIDDLDEKDVDELIRSEEVQAIKRVDTQIELNTNEIKTLNSTQLFAASIPTNHGKLIVSDGGKGQTAVLYFDQKVPEIDVDWPKGTDAELKATGNEVSFHRSVTPDEAQEVLQEVGETDVERSENVHVSVAPKTGEYSISYDDPDAAQVKSITAQESTGSGSSINVLETNTVLSSGGITTQACDCDDEGADLLYCVYQAGSCLGCFATGIPAPPVGIACLVFSCLGGSGGALLSLIADLGCTDINLGCVRNCYSPI